MIKKLMFIFLVFLGLFQFIFADSNGTWHLASDIRGGIFAFDEQDVTTNFSFINNVYFNNSIYLRTLQAYDSLGLSFRTDEGTRRLFIADNGNIGIGTSNPLNKLNVIGITNTTDLVIDNKKSCSKLYSDSSGNVACGIDNVNDADANSTNELQDLDAVLTKGNNANNKNIVNVADPVNNQDVATKAYVDAKTSGSGSCRVLSATIKQLSYDYLTCTSSAGCDITPGHSGCTASSLTSFGAGTPLWVVGSSRYGFYGTDNAGAGCTCYCGNIFVCS